MHDWRGFPAVSRVNGPVVLLWALWCVTAAWQRDGFRELGSGYSLSRIAEVLRNESGLSRQSTSTLTIALIVSVQTRR